MDLGESDPRTVTTVERIDGPAGRHYRTPDGTFPSVTTILAATKGAEDAAALERWRSRLGHEEAELVRVESAARGTALHEWVEGWLRAGCHREDLEGLTGWRGSLVPFLSSVVCALEVERYVWHGELHYAGAFDAVLRMRSGKVLLADWKTSARPKPRRYLGDYIPQLGAYAEARRWLGGMPELDGGAIVIARPDTPAEVHLLSPAELACAGRDFAARASAYHAGA